MNDSSRVREAGNRGVMVLIGEGLGQFAPDGLVDKGGESHLAKHNRLHLTPLLLFSRFPQGLFQINLILVSKAIKPITQRH